MGQHVPFGVRTWASSGMVWGSLGQLGPTWWPCGANLGPLVSAWANAGQRGGHLVPPWISGRGQLGATLNECQAPHLPRVCTTSHTSSNHTTTTHHCTSTYHALSWRDSRREYNIYNYVCARVLGRLWQRVSRFSTTRLANFCCSLHYVSSVCALPTLGSVSPQSRKENAYTSLPSPGLCVFWFLVSLDPS